ncbi:hypothetical protein Tco_1342680 [Tanacetum coccineum]
MNIFILVSLLRYQTNSKDVSFIEPYECPEPVVLETEVSSDQNGQADQNDQNDQPGISINQEKYVKDLLKKYDINGSSVKTLMVPHNKLGPDLNGKVVNKTHYRGMIGSLMYLTASIPDIQFSTCLCSRYQANPKESHLITVKRIFRDHILKGDIELHFILTQYQLADIFTKSLDEPTFKRLIVELACLSEVTEQSHMSHSWICMSMYGFVAFAGAMILVTYAEH